MFLLIFIFFVEVLSAYGGGNHFFKLEEMAVSDLPGELIVPDLKSVSVDQKGNVFAFAGRTGEKECFIVKFDENLKFSKRFGRDGKGPGEFTTNYSPVENRLSIDDNGDVYIVDYNPCKLVVYDNEGNYKKDIPITNKYSDFLGNIYQVKVVGSGVFIALQSKGEFPPHALLFSLEPFGIKVRYPFIEKRISSGGMGFTSPYYGENCIIDADSHHIVFGNSQIYKFQVYDRNGNLKVEVKDESKFMGSFNEKELGEIKNNFLDPQSANTPFYKVILTQMRANKAKFNDLLTEIKNGKNLIVDIKISGERLYLFTVNDDITTTDKWPVEVYNIKGERIIKGYFKKIPAKIWKNFVFFYDRDEEDNPIILKYKVTDPLDQK